MPIKVSKSSRVWLTDNNRAYLRELDIADANPYLEKLQCEIIEEAAKLKSVDEFAHKQRHEEKDSEEPQAKERHKMNDAKKRAQKLGGQAVDFCSSEKKSQVKLQGSGKTIVQPELELAQIREARLELKRLKREHEEMLEVLKLEKGCIDRDRTELTKRDRQYKQQNEQRRFIHDLKERDLQKREDRIREQQETLEWERLNFELMMNRRSEEARKSNAEILERDRMIQEVEAREREDLRIAEAMREQEDYNRRQQAVWDAVIAKLQRKAAQLEEDKAKVTGIAESLAMATKELRNVQASLTNILEEFTAFGAKTCHEIDILRSEHEANNAAIQAGLKDALQIAEEKAQELQDLRFQLVEEDLQRSRNQRIAESGRHYEKVPERSLDNAKSILGKSNGRGAGKDGLSSVNSDAVETVGIRPADKNETIRQCADDGGSPTIDGFVHIGSEDRLLHRDHALESSCDHEDYLDDADSESSD